MTSLECVNRCATVGDSVQDVGFGEEDYIDEV